MQNDQVLCLQATKYCRILVDGFVADITPLGKARGLRENLSNGLVIIIKMEFAALCVDHR